MIKLKPLNRRKNRESPLGSGAALRERDWKRGGTAGRRPLGAEAFPLRGADGLLLCFLIGAVALFILYPILRVAQASFIVDGNFSLQMYRNLWKENQGLLGNSVFVALCSSVLTTLLSGAIAVKLMTCGRLYKRVLTAIIMVALVSPPFISSLAYIQLFGRRGWITHGLLGLDRNPYGWHGIVLMQSLSFAPLGALFLMGMLEKLNRNLVDASRDLGASPSYTLVHIILPLIRPALWACLLLSFIRSLADFGTPIVIGGRFEVLAGAIYLQIIGYADLAKASALNMLILLPVMVLFLFYRRLMRRADLFLGQGGSGGRAKGELEEGRIQLQGAVRIIVNLASGLFFAMMTLQYACILSGGFLKSRKGQYELTLDHLRRLLAFDVDTLARSAGYALVVALAGTLFAMLFSYYVERRRVPFRGAVDFTATIPYMVPGISFGIGYILAFNHLPLKLTGTAAIVILNMLFRQLPNTTKICSASLAQIPVTVEEAARDLGAGRLHVIKDIVLPNLSQAFLTGFIYNFTTAMTTAGAILFLINPGKKVAVFRLFDAVNTGEYGVASLLASCIIVITVAVNLGCAALTARLWEKKPPGIRKGGGVADVC